MSIQQSLPPPEWEPSMHLILTAGILVMILVSILTGYMEAMHYLRLQSTLQQASTVTGKSQSSLACSTSASGNSNSSSNGNYKYYERSLESCGGKDRGTGGGLVTGSGGGANGAAAAAISASISNQQQCPLQAPFTSALPNGKNKNNHHNSGGANNKQNGSQKRRKNSSATTNNNSEKVPSTAKQPPSATSSTINDKKSSSSSTSSTTSSSSSTISSAAAAAALVMATTSTMSAVWTLVATGSEDEEERSQVSADGPTGMRLQRSQHQSLTNSSNSVRCQQDSVAPYLMEKLETTTTTRVAQTTTNKIANRNDTRTPRQPLTTIVKKCHQLQSSFNRQAAQLSTIKSPPNHQPPLPPLHPTSQQNSRQRRRQLQTHDQSTNPQQDNNNHHQRKGNLKDGLTRSSISDEDTSPLHPIDNIKLYDGAKVDRGQQEQPTTVLPIQPPSSLTSTPSSSSSTASTSSSSSSTSSSPHLSASSYGEYSLLGPGATFELPCLRVRSAQI